MTEQRLPGGRHVGGVRIGDTVHRPANPWTPAVHGLLRHLDAVGFDGAPRVARLRREGPRGADLIDRLGIDALRPIAADFEQAAREIDALPPAFWA
ncbi:hypothetical protein [Frankia tisae]|uniref:hypothetical protein n=1 Tax=Frankia tisae TaxID=2950104 RepID=UPI0021C14DDC|nr:hypothetical protein [Frankia tisae]